MMHHCLSQILTLKIFPTPLIITIYTYLFGVIQVGVLGVIFESMPNFALTSFNELINVAYVVCMCVCVCRYYWQFWQNDSYLYGLLFYHGDQNGSYVYGLWFCHGDHRLWQLTFVLCVKCIIESIFVFYDRKTT
jgi:hypothetical protein